MLSQGANPSVSYKMILKIMSKHPEDFMQFKMDHDDMYMVNIKGNFELAQDN